MSDLSMFSAKVETLNSKNYNIWSMKLEALIKSKHLYDVLVKEEPRLITGNDESEKAYNIWCEKNDETYGLIVLSLSSELLMTVRGINKAKELWDLLKKRYAGLDKQRKIQLKIDLAKIEKYENECMEDYLTRAQGMANELAQLGCEIDECELIGYIVEGLSKKYSEVTTAITSNSNITYELMRESLLRYERKYENNPLNESKAFRANERKIKACFLCNSPTHLMKNCVYRNDMNSLSNGKTYSNSRNHQNNFRNRNNKFGNFRDFHNQSPEYHRRNRANEVTNYKKSNPNTNKKYSELTRFVNEKAAQLIEVNENKDKKIMIGNETVWMIDSACTSHMTNDERLVIDEKTEETEIATADSSKTIQAKCRGNVRATAYDEKIGESHIKFTDVLCVPSLRENLISVPSLVKKGKRVVFDNRGAIIYEIKTGEIMAKAKFEDNSFKLNLTIREINEERKNEICLRANEQERKLWHRRLGHLNYEYLRKMSRDNLVRGLENIRGEERRCEICIQGKLTRSPFDEVHEERSKQLLERLHVDLCGPMRVESLGGSRYMLMVVDEFSRRYFVEFVKYKSDVKEKLINIIERRENETGLKVKSIRSDNGTEFTNESLMDYYKNKGIKSERTTIHTPESNGIAERTNRSVITTARTILIEANLPMSFWAEAIGTAVYVHNISPTAKKQITPLEIWTGHKPTVKHMKVFGCKAFYRNENINKNKFEVRAKRGIFVGYSIIRRAYRIYDMNDRKIYESRDVSFIEEENGYQSKAERENMVEEFEYVDIIGKRNVSQVEDKESSKTGGSNQGEITRRVPVTRNRKNNEPTEGVRRSERIKEKHSKHEVNMVHEEVPKSYKDVLRSKNKIKWLEAIDKELNSLEEHNTWKIIDGPKNVKAIRSKWVFTLKENGGEIKYKARLVADGSKLKYKNNQESYSPVIRTESLRSLLAIAAMKNYSTRFFDVETAYLNADLNEAIYMIPPEGLKIEGGKLLLVTGNLYGLPEAGRCWYDKLVNILGKTGLEACKSDPCVFVGKENEEYLAVGIYVDDGIIIGETEEVIEKFVQKLKKEIKIKETEKENIKFLGIEISEDQHGFNLGQSKYIEKILETYSMQSCKSVKTPGVVGLKLDDYESENKVDQTSYQEMLGSLGYLVRGTRPDLAYTISKLSQYAKDPREIHFQAIKRVFRYLQGTKNYQLRINRNKGFLSLCSDASWCTTHDSKSFGGYIVKLGQSVVGWKSNKQKLVALSTMESELLSLCDAVCESKWITDLLEELRQSDLIKRPTRIFTDSQAVIDWINNPRINKRNKHISRKYHFVKDERARGEIEARYVSSSELVADLLTKDLSHEIICRHINSLGIVSGN